MLDDAKSTFAIASWIILAIPCVWFLWGLYEDLREHPTLRSVAILVLGDVGRSPRMMYHAESFAKSGFETFMVGYGGSKPVPSLLTTPNVRFLYLSSPLSSSLPFIITAPWKVLYQSYSILYALLVRIEQPPEFIIVQNPPSIPTLALVWIVAKIRGSKVIIDWHNLGYSILALRLGQDHLFVKIAKWFESYFGRTAYAHLFVTRAMRDYLVREWNLQGLKAVLHDRPPAHFHHASPSETHELFLRLIASNAFDLASFKDFLPDCSPPYSTPFTSATNVQSVAVETPVPEPRPDRPALLVSSTSWTPDEDFGMLLEALNAYEKRAREREVAGRVLPKIFVIVTGKGPLKDQYMRKVGQLQRGASEDNREGWQYVRCVSMWLEAEDYPLLLGSADLGISLHSSSSALDLPMKVVDMFGCGLPVCALGFACLDELVQDGKNGLVFYNAEQLATQLESLLESHPSSAPLAALRESLQDGAWSTWAHNWDRVVRPLVLSDVSGDIQIDG